MKRPRRRAPTLVQAGPDKGPAIRASAVTMDVLARNAVGAPIRDTAGNRVYVQTELRKPTAEPHAWRDPDDLARNARAPRLVGGMRAADPLITLARHGTLTARHAAAADKLRRDHEIGNLGAHPGGTAGRERVDGGGASEPEEMRLLALARFRDAMATVAGLGAEIVWQVVLGRLDGARRDVSAFARALGVEPKTALGLLIGALDRLAEHYQPTAKPIPPPLPLAVAADSAAAAQPNLRLGRWRGEGSQKTA